MIKIDYRKFFPVNKESSQFQQSKDNNIVEDMEEEDVNQEKFVVRRSKVNNMYEDNKDPIIQEPNNNNIDVDKIVNEQLVDVDNGTRVIGCRVPIGRYNKIRELLKDKGLSFTQWLRELVNKGVMDLEVNM